MKLETKLCENSNLVNWSVVTFTISSEKNEKISLSQERTKKMKNKPCLKHMEVKRVSQQRQKLALISLNSKETKKRWSAKWPMSSWITLRESLRRTDLSPYLQPRRRIKTQKPRERSCSKRSSGVMKTMIMSQMCQILRTTYIDS